MTVCFCTLAIHKPYRRRARLLCSDAPEVPWIVLTDDPDKFADLPVRAIQHFPTGPMAVDYLAHMPAAVMGRAAAAYHDKRFALMLALKDFDTAIFVDADSRIGLLPPLPNFASGLAVIPFVRETIAEHLEKWGSWRTTTFVELARHLTGNADILRSAQWCHETPLAVTKDGREANFFAAWTRAAEFLQERGVYSGEGGVIGLAGAVAGWNIDYDVLNDIAATIKHEGGGPKKA